MNKHDYELIIDGKRVPVVFKDTASEATPQPLKSYYKWTTNLSLTDRGIMICVWRGKTQWMWWSNMPLIIEKVTHD